MCRLKVKISIKKARFKTATCHFKVFLHPHDAVTCPDALSTLTHTHNIDNTQLHTRSHTVSPENTQLHALRTHFLLTLNYT